MWFLQPADEDRVRHVLWTWLRTQSPRPGGDLIGLSITAGSEVAFAHGHWQIEDCSHAVTFCLCKHRGTWRVVHQHISDSSRRSHAKVQPHRALSLVR